MRSRLRSLIAPLFALSVCAAVASASAKQPAPIWVFDPAGYFDERDFAQSIFTADVAIISKPKAPGQALDRQVQAIDPATGAMLWQLPSVDWLLHAPGRAEPLYVLSRYWLDANGKRVAQEGRDAYRELRQIDSRSGKVLQRMALQAPLKIDDRQFFFAAGRIYSYTHSDYTPNELSAIDPNSGAVVFTQRIETDRTSFAAIAGDAVIFSGASYRAYALSNGTSRFSFSGMCCELHAAPDGSHIFVRKETNTTAELDPQGRLLGTYPGSVVAVSSRYFAIDDHQALRVYPLGNKSAAVVLDLAGGKDYASAVALHDSELFYYRGRSAKLWRRDLISGHEQAVHGTAGKIVIGPDSRGMSQPHLSTPPAIAPPYLYLLDWRIFAYRLAPL